MVRSTLEHQYWQESRTPARQALRQGIAFRILHERYLAWERAGFRLRKDDLADAVVRILKEVEEEAAAAPP